MRNLILVLLLLVSLKSNGQGWTVQAMPTTTTVNSKGGFAADSTLRLPVRKNVKPSWWNNLYSYNGATQINSVDSTLYWYWNGAWMTFSGGGGSGVTSISQGYGTTLSPSPITTTGSVTVDTTLIASKSFIANQYAPISTTVTLTGLQNVYSKFMYYATLVSPIVSTLPLGSITDSLLVFNWATGEMRYISPSRISGGGGSVTSVATNNGTGITGGTITTTGTLAIDTTTIISTKANVTAVAATKLNITDTATMLTNYYDVRDTGRSNGNVVTGGTLSKVTDSLGALIGGGGVSAASVAEINTGTDNTKFASPLGLAGSEYLDQSGTKVAGTTAGTSTAYTLTLIPAITAYTAGLSLWVKFHVANTGAATINVNGLGAKTLVKDLSTALVANDIPINQWYTLVYDGTNFLIQDIGFGGINLSARLLGALSDETGTGVAVFGTSPTFTTSVLGGATFSAFNTTTTNLSLGGAATTMTIGGTPTTAITHTYSGNATANTITKTLNFGTGGASGSTTAINIGSATSGATNNIKMNITPASDATGDMYYRNASGFLTRIPIGTTGQALRWNGSAIVWRDTAASGGGGSAGGSSTQMQYNNAGAFGGTSGLTWDNVNSRMKFGGGTKASELSIISSAAFGDGNIYIESSDGSGAAITLNSTSGSGKKYSLFSRPTNTFGIYDYGVGAYVAEFNAPDYQSLRIRGTSVDGAGLALNPTASGGTTWTINSPATGSGLGAGRLVFFNGATRMTLLDNGSLALGTTSPSASALLDLTSTTQGLGLPNLTTTQINAISSPKTGLMVFNTTLGTICFYDGAAWQKVTHTTM